MKVGLIGYSQGSIISSNALLNAALQGVPPKDLL